MKMIVSDYDDTFYVNDVDIKNNIKLVDSFMDDNIFVIATGRSLYDYKKKQELYNIKSNYLIIDHGATILKDNKIIYNKTINNDIKNELLNYLELEKTTATFACDGLESRLDFSSNDLTKIHVRYSSPDIAKKVWEAITKKYSNTISAFLVCKHEAIEIVSNEVNKSNAIRYVAELEKIKEQNIYTIGDGYSDVQMVKDFNGYAMVNAVDELKQYANKECKSVSELINIVLCDINE